jgi:hypothetical protein
MLRALSSAEQEAAAGLPEAEPKAVGKRRPDRSKRPSSLPTQESVSPKTGVSAAPISDYALETSIWLGANSFVNRERATLIGLTCLTTNGGPWMAPKLNRRVPRLYSRRSRRSYAGKRPPTVNGIQSSWNWVDICAKFGQGSTGGWITYGRSTSFWKGSSPSPDARPTT